MILSPNTSFLCDPGARAVMETIGAGGYEIFFVGGCVRNALLGYGASDIDMASSAPPDALMKLAQAAGLRAVPTGLAHGTVTLISHGTSIEVTTFRKDIATDGRHARIRYASTYQHDALRRDFTINALYADAQGHVFDPVGGCADIAARRVRFIGDPAQRICEDHLRMLRFFRFYAQYADPGQGIDADAIAAVARYAPLARSLARERVSAELIKLLGAPDPAPALAAMHSCGLLHVILPGSDAKPIAPLVHIESMLNLPVCPLRRLAALTQDNTPLRLSKAMTRQHARLRTLTQEAHGIEEIAYRHGPQTAWDVLALRTALLELPTLPDAAQRIDRGHSAVFPIHAKDLSLGGKALGDMLRALEADWIKSGFALDRHALLTRAHNQHDCSKPPA